MQNQQPIYKILYNAAAADGIGSAMLTKDLRHLVLTLAALGISGESCVVKVQGSDSEAMPTFSSAASITNDWEYIQVIDLESGDAIDGATGITVNADGVNRYELQSNLTQWVNIIISTTSGTFNLYAKLTGSK